MQESRGLPLAYVRRTESGVARGGFQPSSVSRPKNEDPDAYAMMHAGGETGVVTQMRRVRRFTVHVRFEPVVRFA